jgi:hypothetical protein
MKLIIYTGRNASTVVNGVKFTQAVKTANVSDEVGAKFQGLDDFNVINIDKKNIVPSKEDEKLKKYLKLSKDQLIEMCTAKELETDGTKEDLAERLLNSQG